MTIESDPKTETPTDDRSPKDAHLEKAMNERNAAKAKLRDAETQLAEARAKLDAFDQEKQDRETEQARKAGEFSKIEEGYKAKLAAKDKELTEVNSRIAARERSEREHALAEAVAKKADVRDTAVIRGVLRLASDNGYESAPAELTETVLAEALALVRRDAPSLFTAKSTPAGDPGTTNSDGEIPPEFASDPKKRDAYLAGQRLSGRR